MHGHTHRLAYTRTLDLVPPLKHAHPQTHEHTNTYMHTNKHIIFAQAPSHTHVCTFGRLKMMHHLHTLLCSMHSSHLHWDLSQRIHMNISIHLCIYLCLNLHASNSPTPWMISAIRTHKYRWAQHSTTRGEWLPFRIFLCSNGANHPRGG